MAQMTRKDFLKGMGKTVAGVTIVGSLGSVLTGCSTPAATVTTPEPYQWPMPYTKLDPEKVVARAYKGYQELGG